MTRDFPKANMKFQMGKFTMLFHHWISKWHNWFLFTKKTLWVKVGTKGGHMVVNVWMASCWLYTTPKTKAARCQILDTTQNRANKNPWIFVQLLKAHHFLEIYSFSMSHSQLGLVWGVKSYQGSLQIIPEYFMTLLHDIWKCLCIYTIYQIYIYTYIYIYIHCEMYTELVHQGMQLSCSEIIS